MVSAYSASSVTNAQTFDSWTLAYKIFLVFMMMCAAIWF
jgi:hypothetical protein